MHPTANSQKFLASCQNGSIPKCLATLWSHSTGWKYESWTFYHISGHNNEIWRWGLLYGSKDDESAVIGWCHLYPLQHEQCVACIYRPCVTSLLGWWPDSIVCVTCLLDCFSWWESNAHKCSMFCMCIILTLSCPTMHWYCIPLVLCSELVVL